jgi:branched-chain amino acid transport system permease protein
MNLNPRRLFEILPKKKTTLAILTVLFIFPLVTPSRYYMILLAEVFILALLAMSYDLVLGYTGLVSFGHAALFGIGAYVSALLLRMNFSFLPAVFVAILFGALLGLTMGIFTLRVSAIYYALVTLAFAEVILAIFNKWVELSGGETGLSVPRPDFLRSTTFLYFALAISVVIISILYITAIRHSIKKGIRARTKILYSALMIAFLALLIYTVPSKLHAISEGPLRDRATTISVMNIYYFLALIPLIICFFVANRMVNSPLGRIFIAIRENEERAKMLGYDVFKYKLISSTISGIFAGLAGALYAPFALSINPTNVLGSTITINVLLYSILGGLGTLIGPMIGAGIITLLAGELTRIPYIGEYWMLVLGIFYLLIILFLPYGIVITWRLRGTSAKRTFKKLIESIKTSMRKEHTAKGGTP